VDVGILLDRPLDTARHGDVVGAGLHSLIDLAVGGVDHVELGGAAGEALGDDALGVGLADGTRVALSERVGAGVAAAATVAGADLGAGAVADGGAVRRLLVG